ncbi:hypothetical protein IWZ03DRAFT_75430 [Phyllosticta citriasiana]|uniref:Uncharacterized protein n=1 Tax=Phyllosticta citriasiana TaxID=595635 RepID=A0ABR1K942_9PEZI
MCMASQVQPSLPSFLRYSLFRLLPRFNAVGLALSTLWSNCFLRISLWLGLFSDVFSQNLRHSVSGGYGRMGNFGGAGCDEGAGGRWIGHARDGWMGWTDGWVSFLFSLFLFFLSLSPPSFPCLGCCLLCCFYLFPYSYSPTRDQN